MKEFQTTVDKSVSDLKKSLNLPENPDGAAIVKAIKEQNQKAEKALKDMKAKVEENLKSNPDLSGAVSKLKAKIEEAENKLKQENPEVHSNLRKMVDGIQNSYDLVGKELDKLNAEVNKKGGIKDDYEKLLKTLIDGAMAAAKDLDKNVKDIVNKPK